MKTTMLAVSAVMMVTLVCGATGCAQVKDTVRVLAGTKEYPSYEKKKAAYAEAKAAGKDKPDNSDYHFDEKEQQIYETEIAGEQERAKDAASAAQSKEEAFARLDELLAPCLQNSCADAAIKKSLEEKRVDMCGWDDREVAGNLRYTFNSSNMGMKDEKFEQTLVDLKSMGAFRGLAEKEVGGLSAELCELGSLAANNPRHMRSSQKERLTELTGFDPAAVRSWAKGREAKLGLGNKATFNTMEQCSMLALKYAPDTCDAAKVHIQNWYTATGKSFDKASSSYELVLNALEKFKKGDMFYMRRFSDDYSAAVVHIDRYERMAKEVDWLEADEASVEAIRKGLDEKMAETEKALEKAIDAVRCPAPGKFNKGAPASAMKKGVAAHDKKMRGEFKDVRKNRKLHVTSDKALDHDFDWSRMVYAQSFYATACREVKVNGKKKICEHATYRFERTSTNRKKWSKWELTSYQFRGTRMSCKNVTKTK